MSTVKILTWFFACFVVSTSLAVTFGPIYVPPYKVWSIVFYKLSGLKIGEWSDVQEQIIWSLRFPRVILSALVGAELGVAGVILQAVIRNPMADPYILGVSSGASVGAVLVILFGIADRLGVYALSLAAFLGGIITFSLIFILAERQNCFHPLRIVLVGIALSYFFSSLASFLILKSKAYAASQSVLYWLMGSFSGARWDYLIVPAIVITLGTIYLVSISRTLDIITIGDETAITLGIDPSKIRRRLLIIVAILTGVSVAVSGSIGFVALMIPHIARFLVGVSHRRVLPATLFIGGIFLPWVDVIARIAAQPEELPLTIITGFCGVPFFLAIMRHYERKALHYAA